MYTRTQYLNSDCTHGEYYGQFVTSEIINLVKSRFGIERLENCFSKDEHLNNIPLENWDCLVSSLPRYVQAGLKNVGDYLTLAGGVCILKQAARMAIDPLQYVQITGAKLQC